MLYIICTTLLAFSYGKAENTKILRQENVTNREIFEMVNINNPYFNLNYPMYIKTDSIKKGIEEIVLKYPLKEGTFREGSPFGSRRSLGGRFRKHMGKDIKASTGTDVYSSADGTVIFADWRDEYGKMVEIYHGNGLKTRYAHLSKLLVKRRQEVSSRQLIGKVGSTGKSTGPHLHFEVIENEEKKDPDIYLKK